jgi:hypothetical protein
MGWNALAVAAIPPLLHLVRTGPALESLPIALALLGAPVFMYWTLVHLTGIEPSEYYSVRKRPEYAEYQRMTNRFVPGPPRRVAAARHALECAPAQPVAVLPNSER